MAVNFQIPNLLSQSPIEPSSAKSTESTGVSPQQSFFKILSQRTQGRDAVMTFQSPLAISGEIPIPDVAADLSLSSAGPTLAVNALQSPLAVTGEPPVSDVSADLVPSLGGPTFDTPVQLTNTASELVESSGDGPDTAQLALGVANAKPLDHFGVSIDVFSYSRNSGDIDYTAEQNAAGLVSARGKNLPSLMSVPDAGPEARTDMGAVRPPQEGVLQGDPETSGPISTKPVTDTSADSPQSPAQPLTGAARGAMPQTGDAEVKALNLGPTADSVGVAPGISSDSGKPVIAPTADAARQPSWLLEQPVHSRNWEEGFGDRILWLVNNRQPVAELRLSPPHLGTVDVRIAVQGDQAQVAFQAPGGAARDALEAALPRLREMFAEAGINLSDVGVSDHPSQQGPNAEAESDSDQSGVQTPATEAITESGPVEVTTVRNTGQLDLFV